MIEIDEQQRKNMLHALGLDHKDKAFRNYYCCSEDHARWNNLVDKGLAIKRKSPLLSKGDCYFFVTKEGADFLEVSLPKD